MCEQARSQKLTCPRYSKSKLCLLRTQMMQIFQLFPREAAKSPPKLVDKNMQILFLGINGSPGLMEQLWTEEGKNSPLALTEQIVMFKF